MKYQVVIGIEIHLELLTKSKMFSSAKSNFNDQANTNIAAIDLALPGTLPLVNKEAVKQGIKMAYLLNCQIDDTLCFDRKNYFYPDLPKGYQITQEHRPLGKNGYVEIKLPDRVKKITIVRAHLEEDTAKQIHQDDFTLLDYNRAGNPLIEIVSDHLSFANAFEVRLFLEKIRQLASHVGISDAKMEEGSMRCDVNISLNIPGQPLGTKVEIKNINSISNVENAIEFEIKRQEAILDKGGIIMQQTRRFDDQLKQTVHMRDKTDAIDYKYFPESNIFPIKLNKSFIEEAINEIGLLPEQEIAHLISLGLKEPEANIIVAGRFYHFVTNFKPQFIKTATNLLLTDVLSYLNEKRITINKTKLTAAHLSDLAKGLNNNTISRKHVKLILTTMLEEGLELNEIVKKHNLIQVNDETKILEICRQIVVEFPQVIVDIKAGRDNAYQFLIGQVFKKTKGQANPEVAARLIKIAVMEKLNA